jgi:hypothetical protein
MTLVCVWFVFFPDETTTVVWIQEFKASQLQNLPFDMQSLARIEVVSDTDF